MKSVVLKKFALMMNFLLKYQKHGVGQGWEVVWTFMMEHTIPLSMLPKEIPLVTSKNLSNGKIDFSTTKLISIADHESIKQRSEVNSGDILFAMIGSIGNPVLYEGTEEFSIKNMALFKKIQNGMDMRFVYWWLFLSQYEMKKYVSGGVQAFVSLSYLRNFFIPVPPLAEQSLIVSQIEQLLDITKML